MKKKEKDAHKKAVKAFKESPGVTAPFYAPEIFAILERAGLKIVKTIRKDHENSSLLSRSPEYNRPQSR